MHGRYRKGRRIAPLLLSFLLLLSSCAPSYTRAEGYGMGTFLSVSAEREDTASALLPLVNALENEISHRVADSSVARLNLGDTVLLSLRLKEALALSADVAEKTEGAFSPFSLPVTALWDFNGTPRVPDEAALAAALAQVKGASLTVSENGAASLIGKIDLGAVGKGMAADLLADALKERGESGLVSVGGSIAAVGNKGNEPWRVGVRDPLDTSKTVGTLSLSDVFVSTSGSYEKSFTEDGVSYHHIIDMRTGMPARQGLVSVTVVAESGVLSDILSTAVFAVGMEKGSTLCEAYGAHLLAITEDGTLYASEGMRALFTAEKGTVLPL